jgi:Ca-activated chloride channel family protein
VVVQDSRPIAGLVSAFALVAPLCGAQPPSDVDSPRQVRFGSTVEIVALNVTVTARRGYVENLTQDDFVVYDNGVPQEVSLFGRGDSPIDLVLLLDLSTSVRDRVGVVRAAAKNFLRTLRPDDRAAIIGFNQRVEVLANWTGNQAELGRAVDAARASGGTALYGAIYIALRGLDAGTPDGEPRRRALVVLSDGEDTSSLVSYEDVLESCRRSGVSVYTIRLRRAVSQAVEQILRDRSSRRTDAEYVMNALARETGARAFSIVQLAELADVYADIAAELSHQYVLGYVPRGDRADREFHSLSVAVPGHQGAQARTRTGYLRSPSVRRTAASTLEPTTGLR